MTTLALAVDADDELWTLDNLPTPEAPYLTVGDELIEIRSRFPASYYTLTGETLPPRIRVRRGVAGTTVATHVQGSTVTPTYGVSTGPGGGGVTVDNQSDPPAEVTTLIAPGAVIDGDEATLSGVLADPGVAWQATHVYALGDRFAETVQGASRVFEIITAGTSGAGVFSDYVWSGLMIPATETGTNNEGFVYLGIVGQLPWASELPGFSPAIEIDPDDATIFLTHPEPHEESANMFALRATIDGVPSAVFEAKTDGDADWDLDLNTGAGFRFNISEDGNPVAGSGRTSITTDGFSVGSPSEGGAFNINYDSWSIQILGLPTSDPGIVGELYTDGVPSAGVPRTLKVSGG